MGEFKFLLYFFGFFVFSIRCCNGESSTCLMVYKEGGAPAVFQSPKCPRWILSTGAFRSRTANCQSALLQGRRKYQEDRTFCALDIRIPFPSKTGLKEVMVGLAAVFDGHNGAEASEMASKLLLEYFLLHTYFLLDGAYSASLKNLPGRLPFKGVSDTIIPVFNQDEEIEQRRLDSGRCKFIFPEIFDGSFHMEILKESLLRTIHDIDAKFSKEAFRSNLQSGSTATVVVLVDGQILVSNIGDSKAFICSEKFQSPLEAKGTLSRLYRKKRRDGVIVPIKDYDNFKSIASNGLTHFYVKELTRDHHPDRDDERARVEAAGGYVVDWGGVPRVNGELAVSRAIGDIFYKSYGVISSPEVTDWQPLIANDSYVVVASDGIFEKLSTQDVCDLLWGAHQQGNEKLELFSSCQYSLADCIVNTAFEKGSMDNLAVVVVPLRLIVNERYDVERSIDSLNFGMQHTESAYITGSALVPMENVRQVMANFNRLLVKGKQARIGCFYLSENLNEDMDLTFKSQESDLHDLANALPEDFVHPYSGSLNLYNDKSLCFHFGMDVGEDKGQCINPEGFNRLLAVLESIPFHDSGASTSDSFEFLVRDLRYVLHRRFGRGSYGEVWLAFRWNCSQDSDTSNWSPKNMNCSNCNSHLHPYDRYMSSHTNSSTHDCHAGCRGNFSFILKRIMVEKGATVYLSGLREKYFGEVFLNASISLGGLSSTESSNFFSEVPQYDSYDTPETNTSVLVDTELVWSPENMFLNKFRLKREVYEEGLNHVARYVESFESQSKEIWLVFHNEGISLSKLMYTAEVENVADAERAEKGKTIHVLHPSKWWHWLRTSDTGKEEMRNLIWQLLMALKSCHDRNITHRDIKPENLVICFEDKSTGRCLNGRPSEDNNYHIKMRIIDFGSAIDEFSMKHLYGSNGPSRSEQTFEYTPPEALLNATWFRTPPSISSKYDMWSVGVVILELILGSPHVFQINARTQALLDPHLEGWNEDTKELVYKLRSFMEMCILIPGSSSRHCCSKAKRDLDAVWPASWKCSEESFSYQIKSRDPIKLGFPNVWALRLVRQLLLWDPEDRLSVDDALQHPYFRIPPMR